VLFERAYCQFPLCSPSRTSFLTGRRPNVTGVYTNPNVARPVSPHFREKIPATVTLPQLYMQNGWFSARIGKLYHYGVPADLGTSSLDDFYSWDQVINPRGRDRDEHDQIFTLRPGQPDAFGPTLSWLADQGADAEHTDGIGASEAVKLLERFKRESRPFFLGVGFYRPHTPYVAPQKWFDLYPADRIKLPALSADDRSRTPTAAYGSFYPEQDTMSDDLRRKAIQGYQATISFMDAQVGRVIEALDRLGLAQNTIVIFASDHGYHLGDHGLWQKRSLFERSARVPLIISVPGTKVAGRRAAAPVELLDLYPTLAALNGLTPPPYLDGLNLRPMLDNPEASIRKAAISQTRLPQNIEGYSARTTRWRYTEWHSPDGKPLGSQLFDEEADPQETTNLVSNPTHAATVAELSAMLVPIRAQK
jgi:iduronate 2-sulfatase